MTNERPRVVADAQLPEAIRLYLASRQAHDTDAALRAFVDGATVRDEGKTYSGTAAIRDWLGRSASEYTYTVELIGTQRIDDTHYVAMNHLEGNFPGGTVDLRYQFTLRDSLIESLTIEP